VVIKRRTGAFALAGITTVINSGAGRLSTRSQSVGHIRTLGHNGTASVDSGTHAGHDATLDSREESSVLL
jgi:hypothetical protein